MIINYNGILNTDINWYNKQTRSGRVISWFSGGVASMVTCHLALEKYENVFLAFCDTKIEHPECYRLIDDFENKTGVKIHRFSSDRFSEPEEVWRKYKGLGFANGAPCSNVLKAEVRIKQIQDLDNDYSQLFGFDFDKKECRRAINMVKNHAEFNPKFPLIENEMTRDDLFSYCKKIGISPPIVYKTFKNNNCIGADESPKGGCVQGGIGYWQLIKEKYPHKYDYMAEIEHELSSMKGKPVTICKNQSKDNKELLYLKHNPEFPQIDTIDKIKGRRVIAPMDCYGFCGENDQNEEPTSSENGAENIN